MDLTSGYEKEGCKVGALVFCHSCCLDHVPVTASFILKEFVFICMEQGCC